MMMTQPSGSTVYKTNIFSNRHHKQFLELASHSLKLGCVTCACLRGGGLAKI